jgi:hypothetical protein
MRMVPCASSTTAGPPESQISNWAGWMGVDALCPEFDVVVDGTYSADNFTFFRIDFFICDNVTARAQGYLCAPESEIWSKFDNGRVNILLQEQEYNPLKERKPYVETRMTTFFYLLNRGQWQLVELFYRRERLEHLPDLFKRFTTRNQDLLNVDHATPYSTNPVGSRLLTLFLRLDIYEDISVWTVQTILDLVGTWGAFFGVVMGVCAPPLVSLMAQVLGLIGFTFNEVKFYKKAPRWDGYTREFLRAEPKSINLMETTGGGDDSY